MTEVEQDGLALENLLVILTRKRGEAADHPAARAVSLQLADALDDVLHATEQGLLRTVRRALATDDVDNPFIEQREKIMGEVLVSYERLGPALITECSRWLSRRRDELARRRRDELARRQEAEQENTIEREVGR